MCDIDLEMTKAFRDGTAVTFVDTMLMSMPGTIAFHEHCFGELKISFHISQPKHMLWELIRIVSMGWFFCIPKSKFSQFNAQNLGQPRAIS